VNTLPSRHCPSLLLALAAAGASVVAVVFGLADCADSTHLKPATTAWIERANVVACELWMPLATTALAAKLGPLAGLLTGIMTCKGEEAAFDALAAELTSHAAPDAGVGVAAAAVVASKSGMVPIHSAAGKPVALVPATFAPQCQAAQDAIDSRKGAM
jgi:hypothetical protein